MKGTTTDPVTGTHTLSEACQETLRRVQERMAVLAARHKPRS